LTAVSMLVFETGAAILIFDIRVTLCASWLSNIGRPTDGLP